MDLHDGCLSHIVLWAYTDAYCDKLHGQARRSNVDRRNNNNNNNDDSLMALDPGQPG